MDDLLEMSEGGIKANIAHFQSVRNKHAEAAIKAWAEEIKWTQALAMKQNPEAALKNMLTSDCY